MYFVLLVCMLGESASAVDTVTAGVQLQRKIFGSTGRRPGAWMAAASLTAYVAGRPAAAAGAYRRRLTIIEIVTADEHLRNNSSAVRLENNCLRDGCKHLC
jgi:hypothetical protein